MNYYKRHWDDTTGDELTDNWGTSTYYLEVGPDNYLVRQIEIYDNGNVLKYDVNRLYDKYGGLGDQPIDIDELAPFKIDKVEFENIWVTTRHFGS